MRAFLLLMVLLFAGCSPTSTKQVPPKYTVGDTLQTNLPGPKIIGVVSRITYLGDNKWAYCVAYVSENSLEVTCQCISEKYLVPIQLENDSNR